MTILLVALGLSMDAFAVSVCIGLATEKVTVKKALIVGLYFGVFQALMPLIGYFLGTQFADKITAFDHWIAFGLLCFIGGKMIVESFRKNEETFCAGEPSLAPAAMLPLAIATSIDALAVGVTFAFLQVDIAQAALEIGLITLALSMVGVKIGNAFGSKLQSKAEIIGGVIVLAVTIFSTFTAASGN
jgi:putative Mn2+ efflux pump MntP